MKASARMAFAKRSSTKSRSRAFTRLELVAAAATLGMLGLLVLPLLGNTSMRSNQTSCLNNLRQIGVAFQAWGNDYGDRRPWQVPMQEGGSSSHPFRNNAFLHYTFLSNHISPQLLIDPAETDPSKRTATDWNLSPGGFLSLKNNALSYMFSTHTYLAEATDILSSDRNVQFAGSSGCSYGGGLQVQSLGVGVNFRGWTNGPHGIGGNVLVNDGHVEYATQGRLKAIITQEGDFVGSDHLLTPF
jgi:type II secretory pathway pseudopilin PulG